MLYELYYYFFVMLSLVGLGVKKVKNQWSKHYIKHYLLNYFEVVCLNHVLWVLWWSESQTHMADHQDKYVLCWHCVITVCLLLLCCVQYTFKVIPSVISVILWSVQTCRHFGKCCHMCMDLHGLCSCTTKPQLWFTICCVLSIIGKGPQATSGWVSRYMYTYRLAP